MFSIARDYEGANGDALLRALVVNGDDEAQNLARYLILLRRADDIGEAEVAKALRAMPEDRAANAARLLAERHARGERHADPVARQRHDGDRIAPLERAVDAAYACRQ